MILEESGPHERNACKLHLGTQTRDVTGTTMNVPIFNRSVVDQPERADRQPLKYCINQDLSGQ
ncbi:MAG: hypothetical protein RQ741_09810 [Wenzhouxiangellaceae bacterium]|nr:hypothetical protein [Wenzhouxiangellaceae bacterium]